MRKVLVAVFCLFLFGACTQKNDVEKPEIPGNSLELKVRSGDSEIPTGMSASVYNLTDAKENAECEQTDFAGGKAIALKELTSGEYTFFVLGNTEGYSYPVYLWDKEKKILELRWHSDILELFGGIITVNGSNAMETVEMSRLVGGIEVNVLNKDEFVDLHVEQMVVDADTIRLNDYSIVAENNALWLPVGTVAYRFPTKYPVKGRIIAFDDEKNQYFFDFESTKCIERNKKLVLNITLERAFSVGRSGNTGNRAVCVESVTEL